jgi:hypothetical protein
MKFTKYSQINEDANLIIKKIVDSTEYKKIIELIDDLIEDTSIDSEDYVSLKNRIIPKLIARFKEDSK